MSLEKTANVVRSKSSPRGLSTALKAFVTNMNSKKLRWSIQIAFFILCLFIGWKFYMFVKYCESGGTATYYERPPGVEAFLPIGATMGLKYFLATGQMDPIHPAGLIILMTILATGLLFGRGFCSWMCPVGVPSEWLWKANERFWGKNYRLPLMFDWKLRSLKYIILFFFLYQIMIKMDVDMLERLFYQAPFLKVADVKMLKFFTNMSTITFVCIMALLVFSFFNKNFWCRYLCAYGAFLGLLSFNNPFSFRIARNTETCINCGKCTRHCPSYLTVDKDIVVTSPECIACYDCVNVCPVKGAVEMKVAGKQGTIHYGLYAVLLLGFFFGVTTVAKYKGYWYNNIPRSEYISRISELNKPKYQHKRGQFEFEERAQPPLKGQ